MLHFTRFLKFGCNELDEIFSSFTSDRICTKLGIVPYDVVT